MDWFVQVILWHFWWMLPWRVMLLRMSISSINTLSNSIKRSFLMSGLNFWFFFDMMFTTLTTYDLMILSSLLSLFSKRNRILPRWLWWLSWASMTFNISSSTVHTCVSWIMSLHHWSLLLMMHLQRIVHIDQTLRSFRTWWIQELRFQFFISSSLSWSDLEVKWISQFRIWPWVSWTRLSMQ